SVLEPFQIADEISDLVRVQTELGHVLVRGDDALAETFRQRFDWITVVQRPERRSELQRARRNFIDRVTPRAICLSKIQPSLYARGHLRESGVRGQGESRRQENRFQSLRPTSRGLHCCHRRHELKGSAMNSAR